MLLDGRWFGCAQYEQYLHELATMAEASVAVERDGKDSTKILSSNSSMDKRRNFLFVSCLFFS